MHSLKNFRSLYHRALFPFPLTAWHYPGGALTREDWGRTRDLACDTWHVTCHSRVTSWPPCSCWTARPAWSGGCTGPELGQTDRPPALCDARAVTSASCLACVTSESGARRQPGRAWGQWTGHCRQDHHCKQHHWPHRSYRHCTSHFWILSE